MANQRKRCRLKRRQASTPGQVTAEIGFSVLAGGTGPVTDLPLIVASVTFPNTPAKMAKKTSGKAKMKKALCGLRQKLSYS
jgi:hypothetical protein